MMVSLADVKTELGITATTSDAKLQRLIIRASQLAAGAEGLRRAPWLETVLQKLPGKGGQYLKLKRWPIQSVSSITEGTGSSPTTVTASTYSTAGNARRDRLYRVDGWSWHDRQTPVTFFDVDGPTLSYNATYRAGWVMPDQITAWSVGASVAASAWFSAKLGTNSVPSDNPFIFQADATGGTTHASTEPTWPTVTGGTVTDNGITWTAYDQRIPEAVEEMVMHQVVSWFQGGVVGAPANVRRERHGPTEMEYFGPDVSAGVLLREVSVTLRQWR